MFLSDYGLDDEFVGLVHAVVVRDAPGVRIIDLTHGVAPHDVRAGSLVLWRAAPWLAGAVVLAVVDPGVGTGRRPVAVEVTGADGRTTALVGPDNTLLLPAAHALGRITSAVCLDRDRLPATAAGLGATFDGRDLFAPAAARIASGQWTVADAGEPVDPATLAGVPVPEPVEGDDGGLRCEVLWVDRFGNAQLNARGSHISRFGGNVTVTTGDGRRLLATTARAFGALGQEELGLVTDSYGLVALALNRGPAASRIGLHAGDAVLLSKA